MEDSNRVRDDIEFLEWILSDRLKEYWDFDEDGRRLKIKEGWTRAQTEYERIMGLRGKH